MHKVSVKLIFISVAAQELIIPVKTNFYFLTTEEKIQ